MNKLIALVILQLRNTLKHRSILIIFLSLPLFFSLFLIYAIDTVFEKEAHLERFDVALVDLDQSFETKAIIHQLTSSEGFREVVQFKMVEKDNGLSLIKDDLVAAMIIIPENFSNDLRIGKNTPIEVVGNLQRPLQYRLILAMMEGGADLITAAQSAVNTVYVFLKDELEPDTVQNEVNNAIVDFSLMSLGRNQIFEMTLLNDTGSFSLQEYYLAVSFVALPFILGIFLLPFIRNDLSIPLSRRLKVHGFTAQKKTAASFLVFFVILFFQLVLFLLIVYFFSEISLTGNWLVFLAILFLICAFVSMFFTFIASFYLHPFIETFVILSILFFFAIIGGWVLPLQFLPEVVSKIAVLTVTYWFRESVLYSAFIYDGEKIFTTLLVTIGYVALILLVTIKNETRKLR